MLKLSSIQLLSHVQLFATPWTAAPQAALSTTNSWSLPKLIFMESVMPSNHLILCRPLLLLPSIFPSIRVFSNESVLHIKWPNYWSFSFSISPSNVYSVLIYLRIDWLVLLAVQGTLKSLLQHHSWKASILPCSAFFIVQLSHPYMTTGKTIALTRRTFVGKVMSLLFNMLSRLVIAFLLRSKYLLISWLQSPSAVILEPKNIKPLTVSIVSDSLWAHGLYSLWNSPSQNTGVGSLYLLQGIFPTQGSNPDLPHCRQILYQLTHKGRPVLKLKFQYLDHLMQKPHHGLLHSLGKTLMLGKTEDRRRMGKTEDEMVGWHHQLNGHEFWANSQR